MQQPASTLKCKALASNASLPISPFAFGLAWVAFLPACQNADDIIHAARFGDLQKLNACIQSGIQVDHADPTGETALFHVIGAGSDKAFGLLMENNANIRLRDNLGNTTLHKAVTYGRREFAVQLIEGGLDINATNKVGATVLHYAVRSANLDMVGFLMDKGADVGLKDVEGNSSVEVARGMREEEGLSGPMGQPISKKQINKIISALTK
ncbi:MAG TPA: ankyrin repeat domain-containing protein [Verrucomicrobiota bacterium]|nr:ankyrin repeat domain-containing protein [Verrucomicrobiota bacterium]